MCVCWLNVSVSLCHVCVWCSGGQNWLLNLLELELWMAVSSHVGAENQTQVPPLEEQPVL